MMRRWRPLLQRRQPTRPRPIRRLPTVDFVAAPVSEATADTAAEPDSEDTANTVAGTDSEVVALADTAAVDSEVAEIPALYVQPSALLSRRSRTYPSNTADQLILALL